MPKKVPLSKKHQICSDPISADPICPFPNDSNTSHSNSTSKGNRNGNGNSDRDNNDPIGPFPSSLWVRGAVEGMIATGTLGRTRPLYECMSVCLYTIVYIYIYI